MKFRYYRYFMNRVNNLFLTEKSKADLLIENLNKPFDFKWYSGINLAFEPIKIIKNQFIVGYLRKRQSINLSKKDNNLKFTDELVDNRPKTLIIINCSGDSQKWQTIAVEQKSLIFRDQPLSHLKCMFDEINKFLLSEWYIVQLEAILEPNTFWKTIDNVQKKNWKIYSLEFSLNMPNLFWMNDSLDRELKNIQETCGATKTTIKISNDKEWLTIDDRTDFFKQSASYTERWWWNYIIWLKWRNINSKKKIKWEEFDFDLNIENADEETLSLILEKIFDA